MRKGRLGDLEDAFRRKGKAGRCPQCDRFPQDRLLIQCTPEQVKQRKRDLGPVPCPRCRFPKAVTVFALPDNGRPVRPPDWARRAGPGDSQSPGHS
jgi:hypothetical protein